MTKKKSERVTNECIRCKTNRTNRYNQYVCLQCLSEGFKTYVCRVCKKRLFTDDSSERHMRKCPKCIADRQTKNPICMRKECNNKTEVSSHLLCKKCYDDGYTTSLCPTCKENFVHDKNRNTKSNRMCPICKVKPSTPARHPSLGAKFCAKIGEIETSITMPGFIRFCKKNFKKAKKGSHDHTAFLNSYCETSGACAGCKIGPAITKGRKVKPSNKNLTFIELENAA